MSLAATIRVTFDRLDLDVAFEVASGEVVALVGPSGAGKTTILRALAGLIPLRAGQVTLDGAVLEDVAAGIHVATERRPVAVVFHDGLLFPHLPVLDNVGAGFRFRGASRAAARKQARLWLARLGIENLADARPVALSGGQTQRVALARALAVEPRLLLLDEPLSALDVTTRLDMRRELRRHLAEFAGIRLLVTHDPIEALALADRLIVIENGRVVQSGSSLDVTQRPRSRYVADFVGVNWIRGVARGEDVTVASGGSLSVIDPIPGDVFAVIHPRAVALYRERPHGSPRNVLRGTIVAADDEGTRVRVRVAVPFPLIAEVTRDAAADLDVERGGDVWVAIKATEITTYPV